MHRSDMVDAFLYASVKITPSRFFPKHKTRTYQKRFIFSGHPLVTWLCWKMRRIIRVRPWIAVWYAVPDDADPVYFRDRNTLVMGERHYAMLSKSKGEEA